MPSAPFHRHAYVNGHVTAVAPRVAGQVVKVYVDDNNRVRKGDLLVQLDKEPYQIRVDAKKSSRETARADVGAAIRGCTRPGSQGPKPSMETPAFDRGR